MILHFTGHCPKTAIILSLARGSEVDSVTSPTQTPPHLPVVQSTQTNVTLSTESQRCNSSIICRGNAAGHACPVGKRWQPHHWTT